MQVFFHQRLTYAFVRSGRAKLMISPRACAPPREQIQDWGSGRCLCPNPSLRNWRRKGTAVAVQLSAFLCKRNVLAHAKGNKSVTAGSKTYPAWNHRFTARTGGKKVSANNVRPTSSVPIRALSRRWYKSDLAASETARSASCAATPPH